MSGPHALGRLLVALTALAAWACGDATAPDASTTTAFDAAAQTDAAAGDGQVDGAEMGDSARHNDGDAPSEVNDDDGLGIVDGSDAGVPQDAEPDADLDGEPDGGGTEDAANDAVDGVDALDATQDVSPVDSAISAPECVVAADCAGEATGSPCRVWACEQGACALTALPEGTSCAATAGCVQKTCDATGGCSKVVALPCPATACAAVACDLGSGACVATPSAPGSACDDGDPCTSQDGCDGIGACKPGEALICSAGACQSATCAPNLGCQAPMPLPAGVTCSDGDACTLADGCDGKGKCQPGPAQPCSGGGKCALGACPPPALGCDVTACDDANACTVEGCAPSGACVHIPAKGAPCQDGDACSIGDVCEGGACLAGAAATCPGGGACLSAACDPASGACVSVPLPGACTPTDACALAGSCASGACVTTSSKACDDGDPCTADSCSAGLCQHPALPAGQPCGLGLACKGAAASCGCALGTFVAPDEGDDWLRAVAPAPGGGFVAVGDSDAPGSARGLLLRVDGANGVQLQRRYGKPGAVSFVGVLARPMGDVAVGATLGQQHAAVIRLDSLGNLLAQHLVKPFATAEALAAVGADGEALLLCTDAFEADAKAHLLRISADGKLVWQASVAPAQGAAARAHGLVLLDGVIVAAGQDLAVATDPAPKAWLRSFDFATGALKSATPLALPAGSVVLALGAADGGLTLAGTLLNATGAFSARWTAEQAWPVEGASAKAKVEADGGAFAGVSTTAGARIVVGWRAAKGGQAVMRRLPTGADAGWTLNLEAPSQQSLHAVTALPDGTLVAVGSRQTANGSAALWLRFKASGSQSCP